MTVVIQKPIITEKSMRLAKVGLYTFVVSKEADKISVARAVALKFNVRVLSVKILNTKPERKRHRRSGKYYQSLTFKKALVQLAKGQTIALFETPKEEVQVTTAEQEPQVKEKRNILKNIKVKIEKGIAEARPTTQRKVITGK